MSPVVADTTPLRFLVEIGHEGLLPSLFGRIWIPGGVKRELQHPNAPAMLREWIQNLPDWVEVREVQPPGGTAHVEAGIGRGEWEAIHLAKSVSATLLLMDDRAGVEIARSEGLLVTGTLGVLVEATRTGLIDIDEALAKLGATKFRSRPGLFATIAELARGKQ